MMVPSSSTSAGIRCKGLMAAYSGVLCCMAMMSTCSVGSAMPFSLRNMRVRRGFGASLLS